MKLPTIPGMVITYPRKVATYSSETPRTWFGRAWYTVKRRRWEQERAELREWRTAALQGAICAICGVRVSPEHCFVQWSEDASTGARTILTVRCRDNVPKGFPDF